MNQGFIIEFYEAYPVFLSALKGLEHIFNILNSSGFVAGFFTLGALFLFFQQLRALTQLRDTILPLILTIFIGLGIYFAFIKNSVTILVKDASNPSAFAQVNLPALPAGLLYLSNLVERGFIDAIETAYLGDSTNFANVSGGKGYEIILHVALHGLSTGNRNYIEALSSYIDHCGVWYMSTDRGKEALKDLQEGKNNKDIITFLKEAGNPAIFFRYSKFKVKTTTENQLFDASKLREWGINYGTVSYKKLEKLEEEDGTCKEAAEYLFRDDVLEAYGEEVLINSCRSAGLYATLSQCKDVLKAVLKPISDREDLSFITSKFLVAKALNELAMEGNWASLVNYQTLRQSTATTFLLNQYIPVARAIIYGLMLASLPLLTLFLLTTFKEKVLLYFLGMFLWITAWGIMDALAQVFVIEHVKQLYANILKDGNLINYGSLLSMEHPAERGLGLIGWIRSTGIILAGLISYAITQFGGYMLASLANAAIGAIQPAAQLGSQLYTPSGYNQKLQEIEAYSNMIAKMMAGIDPRLMSAQNQALAGIYGNLGSTSQTVSGSKMQAAQRILQGWVSQVTDLFQRGLRVSSLRDFFTNIADQFRDLRYRLFSETGNAQLTQELVAQLSKGIQIGRQGGMLSIQDTADGFVMTYQIGNTRFTAKMDANGNVQVTEANLPVGFQVQKSVGYESALQYAFNYLASNNVSLTYQDAYQLAMQLADQYGISRQEAAGIAKNYAQNYSAGVQQQYTKSDNAGGKGGLTTPLFSAQTGPDFGKSNTISHNEGPNVSDGGTYNVGSTKGKSSQIGSNVQTNTGHNYQEGINITEQINEAISAALRESSNFSLTNPLVAEQLLSKYLEKNKDKDFEENLRDFIDLFTKPDSLLTKEQLEERKALIENIINDHLTGKPKDQFNELENKVQKDKENYQKAVETGKIFINEIQNILKNLGLPFPADLEGINISNMTKKEVLSTLKSLYNRIQNDEKIHEDYKKIFREWYNYTLGKIEKYEKEIKEKDVRKEAADWATSPIRKEAERNEKVIQSIDNTINQNPYLKNRYEKRMSPLGIPYYYDKEEKKFYFDPSELFFKINKYEIG